jgi:hypothetical protein
MTTSKATREYWINIFKGWAETRLSPPQADEAIAVLNEIVAEREDMLYDIIQGTKEMAEDREIISDLRSKLDWYQDRYDDR